MWLCAVALEGMCVCVCVCARASMQALMMGFTNSSASLTTLPFKHTQQELDVQAAAAEAVAASTSGQAQGLSMCDYPNQRVGRIFMQQLPYKSIVSTFAYSVPEQGPQNKYGGCAV